MIVGTDNHTGSQKRFYLVTSLQYSNTPLLQELLKTAPKVDNLIGLIETKPLGLGILLRQLRQHAPGDDQALHFTGSFVNFGNFSVPEITFHIVLFTVSIAPMNL